MYIELVRVLPESGEIVKTSDGRAKVVDSNIFRETVRVRLLLARRKRTEATSFQRISTHIARKR